MGNRNGAFSSYTNQNEVFELRQVHETKKKKDFYRFSSVLTNFGADFISFAGDTFYAALSFSKEIQLEFYQVARLYPIPTFL